LNPEDVGEYTGQIKQIRPITVTTYQTLVYRRKDHDVFPHFRLFSERNWGLIVYDEVHMLPAPVFQVTAELQARRRLGLTATLIREDNKQDDVFALIGPKKFDVPWKDLENQGWIAKAVCTEVRVPMSAELQMKVALADNRNKFRLASENPDKLALMMPILARHVGEPTLIIGMYLGQLEVIARALGAPILTGATAQRMRDQLYAAFRRSEIRVLVVSKVANFAVDLPDASVAIEVSGTFGSRQEEAQRLGRILRPKAGENQAHFYTLVSRDSVEQDFALRRQRFLTEQGYAYQIIDGDEL
jgi:DNA excision repair protein ERCC-3